MEEKIYTTDNIYEVAWLICKGVECQRHVNKPSGYTEFVFDDPDKCKKILKDYWDNKKDKFVPREYVDTIMEVKRKIRQGGR